MAGICGVIAVTQKSEVRSRKSEIRNQEQSQKQKQEQKQKAKSQEPLFPHLTIP